MILFDNIRYTDIHNILRRGREESGFVFPPSRPWPEWYCHSGRMAAATECDLRDVRALYKVRSGISNVVVENANVLERSLSAIDALQGALDHVRTEFGTWFDAAYDNFSKLCDSRTRLGSDFVGPSSEESFLGAVCLSDDETFESLVSTVRDITLGIEGPYALIDYLRESRNRGLRSSILLKDDFGVNGNRFDPTPIGNDLCEYLFSDINRRNDKIWARLRETDRDTYEADVHAYMYDVRKLGEEFPEVFTASVVEDAYFAIDGELACADTREQAKKDAFERLRNMNTIASANDIREHLEGQGKEFGL